MKNIRKDLIENELNITLYDKELNINDYKYIKLSNKVVDNILNHYNVSEITEHFYDAYPGSYGLWDELSFKDLLPQCNEDSYELYWEEFNKLCDNNIKYKQEWEDISLTFETWIDVYGPGIWSMTQKQVNQYAREILKSFRNIKNKEDRIYFYKDTKFIHIYIYNRDIGCSDWHLIFEKR